MTTEIVAEMTIGGTAESTGWAWLRGIRGDRGGQLDDIFPLRACDESVENAAVDLGADAG
jgi:hypothetical protein